MRLAAAIVSPLFLLLVAFPALAQEWPTRPVTLINPFAAGSAVDVAMRAMLRKNGLEDKRDYTVVEAPFPAMRAMLADKKVEVTEAEIIEHCRAELAHYKCPTSVEWRDAFARTSTGKLQKFKIRAPYWDGRDRLVN